MTEAGMGLGRTVAHAARMWNYYLGGKDNYQIDRDVAEAVLAIYPGYGVKARTCRYFLLRAVRFLAVEEGVRQFLDIGTGLPTAENTHEVAQRFAPESRIVYVDNDPLVLAHARSLLTSSPEGVTRFVDADLRDPDRIWVPYIPREPEQIAAYFEGLELIEPGIVPIHRWRPEPGLVGVPSAVDESGGIGRKP
jgi:hypothetical protein